MTSISTKTRKHIPNMLMEYITAQGMEAGERLPSIRKLAKTFKVSPTVVRDELLRLQSAGLVHVHPRAGTFIKAVDHSPMVDIFKKAMKVSFSLEDNNLISLIDTRRLIESEVITLAAQRPEPTAILPIYNAIETMERDIEATKATGQIDQEQFVFDDEQFHLSIARAARNEVMTTILERLLAVLRPYRISLTRTDSQLQSVQETHREIYQCIVDKDVPKARAKLCDHLDYQVKQLMAQARNPRSESLPE